MENSLELFRCGHYNEVAAKQGFTVYTFGVNNKKRIIQLLASYTARKQYIPIVKLR